MAWTERSWLIIHSNTKKKRKNNPQNSQIWSLWTGILVVLCKKFVVKHKTKRFPWWEFKKALQSRSIHWLCFLYYILRRRDVACSDKLHLRLTWIFVSDLTLTKASLPSTAWAEVRALVTLSLAVMKERWVRHFSSSLGATWDDGTHTVSSASRLDTFKCSYKNKSYTYLQQLADHVEMVWCDDVAGLKVINDGAWNYAWITCSMAQMIRWFVTSENAVDSSCFRPHPQISRCPGEGWQRAVWRFPRSHSLWTWGSSELNGSERIPSHRHVLHSWCSCPNDKTFKTKCKLLSVSHALWIHLPNPPIKTEFYFQMLQLFQYHGQVVVLCSASKRKNLFLLSWHAHQHVVKDVVVSLLRRLHMKAHLRHNKNICTASLLLQIFRQPFFSPDDRLWTSPEGIAQRGPLRWPHPWWSWCQCTSRNDWSCHFGLFWHYQRLGRKQIGFKGDSTEYEDRLTILFVGN